MVKSWSSLGHNVDFMRSRKDPQRRKSQKNTLWPQNIHFHSIDLTFDLVNSIPFLIKFSYKHFQNRFSYCWQKMQKEMLKDSRCLHGITSKFFFELEDSSQSFPSGT